jgi:hypothetical protein
MDWLAEYDESGAAWRACRRGDWLLWFAALVPQPFSDNFAQADGTPPSRWWPSARATSSVQGGLLCANGLGVNLATVNQVPAADVAVQASITLSSSGVRCAGLVARYSGPGDSNLYVGEVVGSNGKFTAYILRNVGGTWKQLSSKSLGSGTGLLLFTVKGKHLQLSFNGQVVGDVTDSAITGAGMTGLRSGQGALDAGFSASAL